jgi:hypothetical protein
VIRVRLTRNRSAEDIAEKSQAGITIAIESVAIQRII